MKTAIQQAAEIYESNGMTLADDITRYLKFGYVISSPHTFLLFRPIFRESPKEWIHYMEGDAWHVGMAVTPSMPEAISMMPYWLPFVTWYRGFKSGASRLHVYSTNKLISKLRK